MKPNRFLLYFIFGISLLPKIYLTNIYPALVIKKINKNYAVADEIQYTENRNYVKFSTSPQYQLYYVCPEENAPFYPKYALKIQEAVIDFGVSPLYQFLRGYHAKYNCRNSIKPIALKCKNISENVLTSEYDIGFLMHERNEEYRESPKKYPKLPNAPEYNFILFLTVKVDRILKTIKWVQHRIISRGLLEPDPAYNPLRFYDMNFDFFRFDLDTLYTEEQQKKMFSLIFGYFYFRYYNYPDRCLIKVQLAPHKDFLLKTWKLPSFMNLNTAAMWAQLYPQWEKIEIFVRNVARDLDPLKIETGTAEILRLFAVANTSQPVYLREGQKFPVPQYIWKVVKFEKSESDMNTQAILIVMHNDPYTPNQKPICDDVGENLGWMVSNTDYKTGLTYVCRVHEDITSKLHNEYKANYASLDLNNMPKLQSDENDTYPSLFIIKKPNNNYAVADKFQYIGGENQLIKFSTSPKYQLYNACPEKNAPFYRTYALNVQESVTDFEARPLQQFVKGDFINYNCSKPIKPVVLKSKQKVGKYLIEYHIGFLVHDINGNFNRLSEKYENFTETQEYEFLPFLIIRMDAYTETTLQASHHIVSNGLREPLSAYSDAFHRNEKNIDIYGFDVDSLYTEENQTRVFTCVFPETYSHYFSYPNKSLRKVQLAPHEDFFLNTWKLPSFMELNTVPMWNQLHHQWRRIEIFVRNVARELEPLTIQTGVARMLTFPDVNNKQKTIYLIKRLKFPVRKFFWKLIKFEQSDDGANTQAILIVMHNDPYTPDQEPICDDVSENWGWMVTNKDYKTGLTYGCPVNEQITTKLHDQFKVYYPSFDLNNVQKLHYDKNGEEKWVNEDIVSKISRNIFPSLFINKKPDTFYTVANKFEYFEGQDKILKFSTSPGYQLYNACPEENAPFHPTYALTVQELVTDFGASPLQQFVNGDFVKYNCPNPIKPIALKSKHIFEDTFAVEYDIGFLIHEKNGNFDKLSEIYENFTKIQEYDFLRFLAITTDRQLGITILVIHRIISTRLLPPESDYSDPFKPNEKNFDVYGFDINSLYTEENQQKMFSLIFDEISSRYYDHQEDRCLIKVQLAPHEDFLLNTWKLPSFTDMNTTAMWKQLSLQWKRIEIFVRKVARELEALTIHTGAAGILSMADVKGQQQQVYLCEEQKFPVAKYIWKLIKFEQLEDDYYTQAILIVMHNDPHNPNPKPICEDVSENWGWMISNKDYTTGLTYGCQVVGNITSELHEEYKVNYASLNLNDVQKLEYDDNDVYPSLFVIKNSNNNYAVADKFQYVGGPDNLLKFYTSSRNQLYNACPEEKDVFHPTYALKVQELVKDFKDSPLQQFVEGDFVKYNCWYPIKPIVLKSKEKFNDESVLVYDVGFLMHEKNGNFNKLSEKYENVAEIQDYDFLHFLAITMDRQSGTILSVLHRIISRGLLEPESAYSRPFRANEKNVDVYGFDVNSLYTEENQRKMFFSIFGQSYTDYYNPPNQGLRKVQLAPYDDFLLDTWKLPSLMDLNTAAMWEQLYPQWKRIEIFVRKVARKVDALSIETGAARILSLPDAQGTQHHVHLREEKKSPVPKYIWKLITVDFYTRAILIVMHNDPYNQNQEPICDDVSESLGWMVSNKDYKTGLTYVCPVNENITSKLHDEYKMKYESFDLYAVQKLEY